MAILTIDRIKFYKLIKPYKTLLKMTGMPWVDEKREGRPRVFCIGLNKTGTSSFSAALQILGLKTIHNSFQCQKMIHKAIMKNMKLLHYLIEYTAFSDYPLFRYYKELDIQYPGSKFILNVRDPNDWVQSRLSHDNRWNIANPHKPQRRVDLEQKEKLLYFIESLNRDVEAYFKRRNDLLVIDISKGEGWERLCKFLKLPIPDVPFPHKNENPDKKK
jgi:hypothetical protein